jgi:hypothetical protein
MTARASLAIAADIPEGAEVELRLGAAAAGCGDVGAGPAPLARDAHAASPSPQRLMKPARRFLAVLDDRAPEFCTPADAATLFEAPAPAFTSSEHLWPVRASIAPCAMLTRHRQDALPRSEGAVHAQPGASRRRTHCRRRRRSRRGARARAQRCTRAARAVCVFM